MVRAMQRGGQSVRMTESFRNLVTKTGQGTLQPSGLCHLQKDSLPVAVCGLSPLAMEVFNQGARAAARSGRNEREQIKRPDSILAPSSAKLVLAALLVFEHPPAPGRELLA